MPVTSRCASLLEVEPSLDRFIGVLAAASFGDRQTLPVLTVPAGAWSPPARESLGPGTLALAVIAGALIHGRELLGEGDYFEPWVQASGWTAGTNARMAVLGDEFDAALAQWPQASTRILAQPRLARSLLVDGALEARLEELLWRLARRCGRLEGDGIALPAELDARALGRLAGAEPQAVAEALRALGVGRAKRGGLRLARPGARRGEELRARVAEQFAIARAARTDYLAVSSSLAQYRPPSSP